MYFTRIYMIENNLREESGMSARVLHALTNVKNGSILIRGGTQNGRRDGN